MDLGQDSKKLGKSLDKLTRETRTAEHNGQAIYRQTQKVTSSEITSRTQLYFCSSPRKAAKPCG